MSSHGSRPEMTPSDQTLSRVARELNKRNALRLQLAQGQKLASPDDNLYTAQDETCSPRVDGCLDRLRALRLAYSIAGVKPLAGVWSGHDFVRPSSSRL